MLCDSIYIAFFFFNQLILLANFSQTILEVRFEIGFFIHLFYLIILGLPLLLYEILVIYMIGSRRSWCFRCFGGDDFRNVSLFAWLYAIWTSRLYFLMLQPFTRFYAAVARTAFKGDGQQSLHHFWYTVPLRLLSPLYQLI